MTPAGVTQGVTVNASAQPLPRMPRSVPGTDILCVGAVRNSAPYSVKEVRYMKPVVLHVPPPAMTIIPSPDGTARLLLVWKAASAPRGRCCMEAPVWIWLPVPASRGEVSSHQGPCCKRTVETARVRKVSGTVKVLVRRVRRRNLAVRKERHCVERVGAACHLSGFATTRTTAVTVQMRRAVPPRAVGRGR